MGLGMMYWEKHKKIKRKCQYPNQYIIKEFANGVMCNEQWYPFQTYAGGLSSTYRESKKNVRYFIRTLNLSVRLTGIYEGGAGYVNCYRNGSSLPLLYIQIPQTTLAEDFWGFCQDIQVYLLADENKPIQTGLNPTSAAVTMTTGVTYCEIDCIPANMNPVVIIE